MLGSSSGLARLDRPHRHGLGRHFDDIERTRWSVGSGTLVSSVANKNGGMKESVTTRWFRRVVSLTLYTLLLTLALSALPLWLALALFVDLVRPRKFAITRTFVFLLMYLTIECAGVLGAAGLWLGTLGGTIISRERWLAANAAMQRWFSGSLFSVAGFIFSFVVKAEGLDQDLQGPFLTFVRHSSTADTILTAALVANRRKIRLRYVLKTELLWDPCLDIVGQRLPNAFVGRGREARDVQLGRLRTLAQDLDDQAGVLIYPEGTRFSTAKLAKAKAALAASATQELAALAMQFQSVLPPKVHGPVALLQAFGESSPKGSVLFVEHSGFEGAASFGRFLAGELVGAAIHMRLRAVPISEVPASNQDAWLLRHWLETDRWVTSKSTFRSSTQNASSSIQDTDAS
jgi:1-acyl-sn-glycerol-3-phosphate acyltransferase